VTAAEGIEEIKHLHRDEQSQVVQFAFDLARDRQMSGEELAVLAQQLLDAKDPADANRLREEMTRGFCGEGELVKTFLKENQTASGIEL